jgi:rhamnosyltransferase
MKTDLQHVFLVGAKGLGSYGGYETFIDKLTAYHEHCSQIQYHVACKANGEGCMDEMKLGGVTNRKVNRKGDVTEFTYHGARCFKIHVPQIGSAQAIYYDLASLHACCKYIETHRITHPIVYVMACRIGPFATYFYHRIHKLGGRLYLNPDGHEWMRAKWSLPVRKYWKQSERMMVKYSDLVICDSVNIETYIHRCYDSKGIRKRNPMTTYIAYGAETRSSALQDHDTSLTEWYQTHGLRPGEYYLVVGRFVPENNYETMIREFMKSKSQKDFAIITNVNEKFLSELEAKLHFKQDPRIKFVGTVYTPELLMKIREQAYAYFHGHEVGGTNPSLLEALGSTELNLLLDVGFNREVAEDAALYWTKYSGNLAALIESADQLSQQEKASYGEKAKARIRDAYSWEYIASKYEKVFLDGEKEHK